MGSVTSKTMSFVVDGLQGLRSGGIVSSQVPEQRYSNMLYGLWPLVSSLSTTGLGLHFCSGSFTEDPCAKKK